MKKIILRERQVTLDGLMTLGKLDNGQKTLDFECCEDVLMEVFNSKFKVQGMRDGNIYMTELPRRKRNKPLFRDDNSSLSLGRDGRFYFYFSLPAELVDELPQELLRQAIAISQKVLCELIKERGYGL